MPEKAELLAHHRHDKVVVRFGQIEHLLRTAAHAHAEEAAGTERIQGLHKLIPRILGIRERIEKRHQTPGTVRFKDDQGQRASQTHADGHEQINKPGPADQAHKEQDQRKHHGPAEIRLGQQQKTKQGRHGERRDNTFAERLHQLLLGAHEVGQIEGKRDLGELQRLNGEEFHRNPTLRPVDARAQRTQGHKQQHQYKQQERILEFVQDVARHSRKNPHDNPAYDGINELTLEKEILGRR